MLLAKYMPLAFTAGLSDKVLSHTTLTSVKASFLMVFLLTIFSAELKKSSDMVCDFNPMTQNIKKYIMGQIAGENMYTEQVTRESVKYLNPTMDLHVKSMLYVISLWCIHMFPGVVSFYLKSSADFLIKPVIQVFEELDSNDIPLIENYSMTRAFMNALQSGDGEFSKKFYKYTTSMLLSCVISHIFGMIYFHTTFGLNFSAQNKIPDVYYFLYEYEVVYGRGLVQCYWVASKIMHIGILFFSYAYLFGSFLLVYEIMVVYYVTLQGFNELLEFFVESNVSQRQAMVIKIVSMGLLDLQYESYCANTVDPTTEQSPFDQHQVNEADIRASNTFNNNNNSNNSADGDASQELHYDGVMSAAASGKQTKMVNGADGDASQELHYDGVMSAAASGKQTEMVNGAAAELDEGMSTSSGAVSSKYMDYHDVNKHHDDLDNSAMASHISNSEDKRKKNSLDDSIDISVRRDVVIEALKDEADVE